MKIPINAKPKQNGSSEGIVMAEVKKVELQPSEKNPKHFVLHFGLPEGGPELSKKYPLNFEDQSPLRKDLETIMGRSFTADELAEDYDTTEIEGKKVPAVVMLRAGAGGKPTLVLGPVFSVKKLKQTVAALE